MRLILFHSITSGSGKPSGKQLRETFEKAGHEVEYVVARSDGWKQSLSQLKVECPQCGSSNTKLASEFGSTACKALFICNDCKEPFDHFKCH